MTLFRPVRGLNLGQKWATLLAVVSLFAVIGSVIDGRQGVVVAAVSFIVLGLGVATVLTLRILRRAEITDDGRRWPAAIRFANKSEWK